MCMCFIVHIGIMAGRFSHIKEDLWEHESPNTLIYHDNDIGDIIFTRKTKKQKMRRTLVWLTCEKIDDGPNCLLRLVLLKRTLASLNENLAQYPCLFYLKLTNQKHPYKHLLL